MNSKIPLFQNEFDDADLRDVRAVLESGWLTQGEQVEAFEQEFAAYHGISEAVAVANCTAALHLALLLAGIGPGDEVIVPSLTFIATVNAVRYVGATPVFADIHSLDEPLLSAATLAACLTPRTRALVVVHYAGYACDMDPILELAARHGLVVVEDAAHGPGVDEKGRWIGSVGDYGCFSFYGNKNVSCGEGGMLLCRRKKDTERARLLRCHGMTQSSLDRQKGRAASYDVVSTGFNYRFDDMRAAIARNQLCKNEERHQGRRRAVETYRRLLGTRRDLIVPFASRSCGSYHIMPILLPEGTDQSAIMAAMRDEGIFTSLHYPPVHRFSDLAAYRTISLPLTENYARRVLTLPLYPTLTDADIARVVRAIP